MYTFAYELTLYYLHALGLREDEDEYKIQNVVNECDIEDKIGTIAHSMESKIRKQDGEDHSENWRARREAYTSICDHFFEFVYGRSWTFDIEGDRVPGDLSDFFSDLFTSEADCGREADYGSEADYGREADCISHALKTSHDPDILQLLNNMHPGDIKTLDIQARQYIFVYCYEHGINIGLH
jgi:hypothetical protein